MNSGKQANYTGSGLEDFVEWILQTLEYKKVEDGSWLFKHRRTVQGKYYARQVYVGEDLYEGNKRIVDLFVVNNDIFPDGRIIECKWQEAPGSVEKKFPHLALSIQKTGIPTIVVLDGSGCTLGAIRYLKSKVDHCVFLAVWSMEDFQRAKNAGFFGTGILPSHQNMKQTESDGLWEGLA